MQFVLDSIHKRNFKACDKAVREVFGLVSGDDVRVATSFREETKADSLKVVITFGKPDDAIVAVGEFRQVGETCTAVGAITITNPLTCPQLLAQFPSWKINATTVGVVSATTPGGVNFNLIPSRAGCVEIVEFSVTK
jgi:hypothetical protein